jgi:2,5-diamino-6-(ribosylamino)-4(3H)-pyrimidinone 5'-phosphate reductase
MMPSVDGRLRTDRWNVSELGHREYDRVADRYKADAWLCGRVTMEEFAEGKWRSGPRPRMKIPRQDHVVPKRGERYAVAIDSRGTLRWKAETQGDSVIAVLAESVPDAYLQHLRERMVSYIFAGKSPTRISLPVVLRKLRGTFGIRRLLLEGGGETNGSFLRAGLVDELSLLLTPVADGRPGEPALFDVGRIGTADARPKESARAVAQLKLQGVKRVAADMVWVRYRVRR